MRSQGNLIKGRIMSTALHWSHAVSPRIWQQDRRGTGRSLGEADELGETERLRVENRLLRASIKNLKEERHVLKKHLSYLERRIAGGQAGDEGRSA